MTSTVRRSSLVALTCVVSTVLTAPSPFRFHDAPEDEDTRVMRSFPKISFDDLQTQRYCYGHKEHFQNYCDGANALSINAGRLTSKLEKFCPSYVKHCPEEASKIAKAGPPSDMFREPAPELIIPPSLPTAPEEVTQFDLPLPSGDTKASEVFAGRPLQAHQLNAAMIRTCTPDCTAPHCTTECKCHHSHEIVHARCNPPSDSHMANVCQAWYSKCPMYKPLAY